MKYSGITDFAEFDNIAHIERGEIIRSAVKCNGDNRVVVRGGRQLRHILRLENSRSSFEGVHHSPGLVRTDNTFEFGSAADVTKLTQLCSGGEQRIAPFPPEPVKPSSARVRRDEGCDKNVGVENDLQGLRSRRASLTAWTARRSASWSLRRSASGPGLRTSSSHSVRFSSCCKSFANSLAQYGPRRWRNTSICSTRSLGSSRVLMGSAYHRLRIRLARAPKKATTPVERIIAVTFVRNILNALVIRSFRPKFMRGGGRYEANS